MFKKKKKPNTHTQNEAELKGLYILQYLHFSICVKVSFLIHQKNYIFPFLINGARVYVNHTIWREGTQESGLQSSFTFKIVFLVEVFIH